MIKEAKKKKIKDFKAWKKKREKKLKEEEHIIESIKFWQETIIHWDHMTTSKKVKKFWWEGLPSSVRGKIWKLVIGNELKTDISSFKQFSIEANKQDEYFEMIKLDVSRTLPYLGLFQSNIGPYHQTLLSLLMSYNMLAKSYLTHQEGKKYFGYCQGMSFLAAMLILNMPTPGDAFIAFANLIHKTKLLQAFFQVDQRVMQAYYSTYQIFFHYNIPQLHKHFQNEHLTPDLYLVDWIYTIFSKSLPLDISTRIWDLFLRDKDEFIFRCALGILKMYHNTLIKFESINLAQYLTKLPEDINEEKLFLSITKIKMTLDGKHSLNGLKTFDAILNHYLNTK